jgi:hypothetical protein
VLEAALRIDPASGQVQFNLGELARVAGDPKTARARYEAALGDPVTASRAEERLRSIH